MVYLLENSGYYKIGFTEDLYNRLSAYRTNNPIDVIVIDVIEGLGQSEEKELHDLLKDYNYRNEWYVKDKKVLDIWKNFKFHYKNPYGSLSKEVKAYKELLVKYKEQIKELKEDLKKYSELGDEIERIKEQFLYKT